MPSCSASAEGLRNNHPANLLRAPGQPRWRRAERTKISCRRQAAFSVLGKSVVEASSLSICTTVYFTGTNCSPCQSATRPFFICRIHLRKTARFTRHQVVILFTLLTVGGLQAGAVGEDPQCRIPGVGQRAVGVLKAVVHLTRRHHQNGADAGGRRGHRAAFSVIALGIAERLIEPDNAVVALFVIRRAFVEEADDIAGPGRVAAGWRG